jgi:hypothetical protein
MLTIRYHRSAKKELLDSSLYYSRQVAGLGEQFLNEVDLAIRQIVLTPDRFPPYFEEVRRCVRSRFLSEFIFAWFMIMSEFWRLPIPVGIRIIGSIGGSAYSWRHARKPDPSMTFE